MALTTLGPDHCDLHILEHPSEDKQTELEEIELKYVVKTEESDDSMSVDGHMEVKHEDDNNFNDYNQDPLKVESVSFQCTLCLEEFVDEHEYMQHKCMHIQNHDGDAECVDRQADPSPSAHVAQITVVPVSAIFANNNENEVRKSIAADAEQIIKQELETNSGKIVTQRADSKILTNCVQLHDNLKCIEKVPTRDKSMTTKLKAFMSCYVINIACKDSSYRAKTSSYTEERLFTCDICGKMFKQKCILANHIRSHIAFRRFTCKICQHKFQYKSYLIRHMQTHTGEKPYKCKLCEFKCAHIGTLTYHMRTHTGEKPYSCELCEFKCAHSSYLKHHMKTHTGEKPYSCELCEFKCAQSDYLKYHMKTHTGEKPYSCELCKFKCAKSSRLKCHMKTHTGEKPYSCELCEFKCSLSYNLKRHMKTHTGEKPYSCELCDFKCAQSCSLKCHMRTHTGEKPYSCELCEYKCTRKGLLKLHNMKTHTGEKPYIRVSCASTNLEGVI